MRCVSLTVSLVHWWERVYFGPGQQLCSPINWRTTLGTWRRTRGGGTHYIDRIFRTPRADATMTTRPCVSSMTPFGWRISFRMRDAR